MKRYTVRGVKGGNYSIPKKFGAINIGGQIRVDNFQGSGAAYREREESLINIYNSAGRVVFTGTVEELVIALIRAGWCA